MSGSTCGQCGGPCSTIAKDVTLFCSLKCLHAWCRARGLAIPVPMPEGA